MPDVQIISYLHLLAEKLDLVYIKSLRYFESQKINFLFVFCFWGDFISPSLKSGFGHFRITNIIIFLFSLWSTLCQSECWVAWTSCWIISQVCLLPYVFFEILLHTLILWTQRVLNLEEFLSFLVQELNSTSEKLEAQRVGGIHNSLIISGVCIIFWIGCFEALVILILLLFSFLLKIKPFNIPLIFFLIMEK